MIGFIGCKSEKYTPMHSFPQAGHCAPRSYKSYNPMNLIPFSIQNPINPISNKLCKTSYSHFPSITYIYHPIEI